MRLIIIDDELSALNTFLTGIADKNYDVRFFNNDPLASVDYIKNSHNKTDIVFLDINMPAINGVDLAEKIVQADKSIKIIFITGYAHDQNEIKARLKDNFAGFFYKPFMMDELLALVNRINKEKPKIIEARTFGSFDLYVDGQPVRFSCAKSKELLALLIDRKGAYLNMGSIIACLWPDCIIENAKRLYRHAVFNLRKTLAENGLNLVEFCRAKLRLYTDGIKCDLWDCINGAASDYRGSYMEIYDWSIETQSFLDNL